MDSLTHIALGACIGEAFFEKGFGKKVMLWGILAQSIPDIDFIAGAWLNTPDNLLAHRGITHSILFAVLVVPLLALCADRVHKPHNIAFKTWLLFFSTEVFLHLLIDSFNNYGVGWFEPVNHIRFSLNALYVADPFFSIWPGVAFVALVFLGAHSHKRKFWWMSGMLVPFLYLGYCAVNKVKIDSDARYIFANQQIPYNTYFTTPAPLQNWLWFVVAGNDSGYYVGYRSLLDKERKINFQFYPRNDSLLKPYAGTKELVSLIHFSQGIYTAEKWGDTLVFNDLRFGQELGWQKGRAKFAFHYFLSPPLDNTLVVQRGRFAGWNGKTFISFCKRVGGI